MAKRNLRKWVYNQDTKKVQQLVQKNCTRRMSRRVRSAKRS